MPQQPNYSDQSFPAQVRRPAQPEQGDATHGLIPYKNPQALLAYYLGLLSLIPILGLFFAIPAVVLGFLGLRAWSRNRAIKGSVHAMIGIVMGWIFGMVWGGATILLIAALILQAQG